MCLAVTGRILAVEGEGVLRSARVLVGTEMRQATLAFTPEATVGDWVLVHSGHAISIVSQKAAGDIVAASHEMTALGSTGPPLPR